MKKLARGFILAGILLFTTLLGVSPPQKAGAATTGTTGQMKAYSIGGSDMKKLTEYMSDGRDERGFKVSQFGMKLAKGDKCLYTVSGKKLDLTAKCKDKNGSSTNAPYRYYFWFRSNKLHAPNTKHWGTVKFQGTFKKIEESTMRSDGCPVLKEKFNSKQKGTGSTGIERVDIDLKSNKGLIRYNGKTLSKDGMKHGISFYVIDVQDWYKKNCDDIKGMNTTVYLQSVTQIFSPSDKAITGEFYKLYPWWKSATEHSFTATSRKEFHDHYNQWFKLTFPAKHKVYVHRIGTTEEKPKYGDENMPIDGKKDGQLYDDDKIERYSKVKFKNIGRYEDKDDQGWALKGIRIVDKDGKKKTEAGKFFILDTIRSSKEPQITGTTNSTKNYSSGTDNTVKGTFEFNGQVTQLTSKDGGNWSRNEQAKSTKGHSRFKNEALTGKKTWNDIVKYLESCAYKTTTNDTHFYLVYAPIEPINRGGLHFTASYWQSKGGDCYEKKGKTDSMLDVYTTGSSALDKQLKKDLTKNKKVQITAKVKLAPYINSTWKTRKANDGANIEYTPRKYQISGYTVEEKNGKRTHYVSEWKDLTTEVWDGTNGKAGEVGQKALTMLKNVTLPELDYTKGITIELAYYQPLAPSKMKVFLKKYNTTTGAYSMECIEDGAAVANVASEPKEGEGKSVKAGVTRARVGVGVSYSTPKTPSFTPPSGYRIVRGPSLESGSPYTVNGSVAGYLGESQDCVSSSGATATSGSRTSGLSFKPQMVGTIGVAVFAVSYEKIPEPQEGDNPPSPPPTYGFYQVVKHFATTTDGKVPAKDSSAWVDSSEGRKAVCTTNGATQPIRVPSSVNGGTIVPQYSTSSSASHCANGFSGNTSITWGPRDTTVVRLDIYYWKNTKIPPGSVVPSEDKTTYTWDDTDGGGEGSSFENPTNVSPEKLPLIQGKVEGDSVQEIYQIVSNPNLGSEGEILLPNGTNAGGNYVANTLKNVASCTSYLSRGSVTKHVMTYRIPVTFIKTFGIVSGDGTPIGTDTKKVSDTLTIKVVYFSLDKLEIMKPDGAWIFNYAYSEVGESGAEAADKRTPNDKFHTTLKFNGGEWDWGEAKKGNAQCTATGLENVVFDLGSETLRKTPSDSQVKDECSEYLKGNMMSFLEEHFSVKSDTLIFKTPKWNSDCQSGMSFDSDIEQPNDYDGITTEEEGKDVASEGGQKYDDKDGQHAESDQTVFDEDLYAFDVKCSLYSSSDGLDASVDITDDEQDAASEYSAKKNYESLIKFSLEDVRVLAPCYSNVEDLFSNSGIKIPKEKLNTADEEAGEPRPDSSVMVMYTPVCKVGLNGGDRYFRSDNVNKVTLHTPIAISVSVQEAADDMIQNTTEHEGYGRVIPLGTPFTLKFDYAGEFAGIYGTVDTKKYTLEDGAAWMQFDYESWVKHPDGKIDYHPEGERYKLYDVEKCTFYAAYWAQEGNLPVHVTVECLNAHEKDCPSKNGHVGWCSGGVLPKGDCVESTANLSRDNYCAQNEVMTDLNGRIFGLRQYDVSDYPTLQGVFRVGDSYTRTGNTIASGSRNFLGQSVTAGFPQSVATFPIVDNDSIGGVSYDAYKTGYVVRYNVTTIASLTNQSDNLMIEPTFYWVKKGPGVQEKKKVKLYYNENVNGKNAKLVEIGSKEDKEHWHQICIGDPVNNVNTKCLVDTSMAQMYSEPKDLIQQVANTWTYSGIRMPASTAVCEGDLHREILSIASDGTRLGLPDGLGWSMLNRCLQTWYGEYYLPNDLHVRLDNSEANRAFEEDGKSGYDFSEDYWCNDGFLVVNFNIRTVKAGVEHLSYDGTVLNPGHMDMWKQENYCKQKWGDWFQSFEFNEGDFIVYDLEASMSDDYRSGGTH